MTRSLRDCVSRDVERALMTDVVVRVSFSLCLVKVREQDFQFNGAYTP
jgi:hypothetical protein